MTLLLYTIINVIKVTFDVASMTDTLAYTYSVICKSRMQIVFKTSQKPQKNCICRIRYEFLNLNRTRAERKVKFFLFL